MYLTKISIILASIIFVSSFLYSASAEQSLIPSWITNNAGLWADDKIGNSDFVQGIQYLIKNGIMKIPSSTPSSGTGSNEIPIWIKNNAGWWAKGQISDNDFVQGIQWLITNSIIKIEHKKPIAKISGNGEIRVGDIVTFDGTESYDPDGMITTFSWLSSSGEISSTNRFTVKFNSIGEQNVKLKVCDNDNLCSDYLIYPVQVKPELKGPIAKIIKPGPTNVGSEVTFRSNSFDQDGGTIQCYQWRADTGLTSTNSEFKISFQNSGSHTVFLKVCDNHNLWSQEVSETIWVSSAGGSGGGGEDACGGKSDEPNCP